MSFSREESKINSQIHAKSILTTHALITHMISFLPGNQTAIASAVCKDWQKASESESLWRSLLIRDENLLILPPSFKKNSHGSSRFFYTHGKLMVNKIRCEAIESFKNACIEHSLRLGFPIHAMMDFINLPDNFFIAYHHKLIPTVLVTGKSAQGMDNPSIVYMDNPNLLRIKSIFDGCALTLLNDKLLNQIFLRDIIYRLALQDDSHASDEWVKKYEYAFMQLDLGKLIFLKDNHKIFTLIPEEFIKNLDAQLFSEILEKINNGEDAQRVIAAICTQSKKHDTSCLLM